MQEFRRTDGELRLLERVGEFIFPVELWMLNDGVTRNNWKFINLDEHRALWAGVPILVAYVNGGRTVGSGHNSKERFDPKTGEQYQSFTDATAERIVGAISDSPEDIRLAERDGNTWVVAKGFLWAWYARELVTKIAEDAEQGRTMSVSIEALVTQSSMEGGVEIEEKYTPLGVTVLGDRVLPAVPDAHIAMLSAMRDEFKELKLRAASYIAHPECAETDKPQKSCEKGMIANMKLSKQQLKALQSKFDEANVKYRLLAAKQYDDGSVVSCLVDGSGSTATYTFASLDEGVYSEKLHVFNAQVHFCADGKEDVCVDASDMTECAGEDMKECKDRAEKAESELAKCRAELEAMKRNEGARRLAAAKKTATDTLAAYNADREEKVNEKCLEALNKEIEAGKFTSCEDANGMWSGDTAVREKVLSVCALADMEYQKKLASKKSELKPMTWGNVRQAAAAPGSVGEFYASQRKN